MVSGPMNCIKYLVFAFNLIFFLFGITLIGVGAYVQAQLREYLDFFNTNVNGPAILLICIGLVVFVISFFGCCGAIKENYCMVLTFSILMVVILVCQIAGAIAGFVYYNKIEIFAKQEMNNSMKNYGVQGKEGVTATWDTAQEKLNCCGTSGPSDWNEFEKYKLNPPASCTCKNTAVDCEGKVYKNGCYAAIKDRIRTNVYYIGAVGIALAVIQVTGVVLACCLARAVRREYDI